MAERIRTVESAAVVYNPKSGRRSADFNRYKAYMAIEHLRSGGWDVEPLETKRTGHATDLAKYAVDQGHTHIFAMGGDGTLRQVVEGVVGSGSDGLKVAVGFLPNGSENVWAFETDSLNDPRYAVNDLLNGELRIVDTGEINGNSFLQNSGYGMDGEVFHNVQKPGQIKMVRGGIAAHLLPTLQVVPQFNGVEGELVIGDEKIHDTFTQGWAGNTAYLGPISLRPEAKVDDGLLEFSVFTGKRGLQSVHTIIFGALFKNGERPGSFYRQGTEMTMNLDRPVALQADGDSLPRSDTIRTRVLPNSLQVLVPRVPNTLFSKIV